MGPTAMRNTVLILALLIVSFETPTLAGEVSNSCAVIADQAQRLACYDLLASKAPKTTKQKQAAKLADRLKTRMFQLRDKFEGLIRKSQGQRQNLKIVLGPGSANRLMLLKTAGAYCGALLASGRNPLRAQTLYETTLFLLPTELIGPSELSSHRFICKRRK